MYSSLGELAFKIKDCLYKEYNGISYLSIQIIRIVHENDCMYGHIDVNFYGHASYYNYVNFVITTMRSLGIASTVISKHSAGLHMPRIRIKLPLSLFPHLVLKDLITDDYKDFNHAWH